MKTPTTDDRADAENEDLPATAPFYVPSPLKPVWHRNMPSKFPFDETPFIAEVMSRENL